ncbi:MAG TPA: AbrB/MazE/SpoVT family DNA-binding domain-containing protein [Thermomicrobiales bacterium]|nr:AbrB/MazE/SpoVT family DNA-binding domain-containing protein [Thermomicrobiales bacterium]
MRTLSSRMTSKGQVTIPAEIRAELGLKPRDSVQFTREGDRIVIRPMESAILKSYGSVRSVDGPVDFRKLREEFEQGVADEVMSTMD